MDKKIAGLLGAAAALTAVTGAQASPPPSQPLAPATSYRDLLDPIANPVQLLQAENARAAGQSATQVAQISVQLGHHHHHHHHFRVYHHHHHHHHHHFRVRVHHHHHHHHHYD